MEPRSRFESSKRLPVLTGRGVTGYEQSEVPKFHASGGFNTWRKPDNKNFPAIVDVYRINQLHTEVQKMELQAGNSQRLAFRKWSTEGSVYVADIQASGTHITPRGA